MSVYFLRSRDLIKIGFSDNVPARVAAQIAATPFGAEYIGYMPGGREVERHLHQRFAAHKVKGEWFQSHETLLRFIDEMAILSMPGEQKMTPAEALGMQEVQQVETVSSCLGVICDALSGDQDHREKLKHVAPAVGIDFDRLWILYQAKAEFATAGELVMLEDFMRRVNIGRRNGWDMDRAIADPENQANLRKARKADTLPNEPDETNTQQGDDE